ncbi:tigger transposable element-derived protein 4-like [Aphis craccivora]|uniref:Tigger transposable element-derived protein 4-like n=1 Tax=Aphis craccivora TaxID=307492 RepID=A0A6G0YDV0_APHCR|nr:tigger transposable element-derived protein 4-like [Aphis craccivora]
MISLQLCPIYLPKVNTTSTKRTISRKRKSIVLTDIPIKLELEKAKENKKWQKIKQEKLIRKQENSKQNKVKLNFNTILSDEETNENYSEQKCVVCGEFGFNEGWYRCRNCGLWAHALCT